jgi:nucleotide-binding universal stress UspA family protein
MLQDDVSEGGAGVPGQRPGQQRIVVGVDDSEGGRRALRWALEDASRRQARVVAVLAWHRPLMGASPAVAAIVDPAEEQAFAEARLAGIVGDALEAAPAGVVVDHVVTEGSPARTLLDEARGADLLVVGSRGRGGFAGLLLGSVSQHCVHHAPCPVVVVRP